MIHKKSIDGIVKKLQQIESDIYLIKQHLDYMKGINLKDYSSEVDKEQVRQSVEDAENYVIRLILDMNKTSEDLVKKIDIESWREYKESKDD